MTDSITETVLAHYAHILTIKGIVRRVSLGKMCEQDFQRFAVAVGDESRELFETEFAKANGHKSVVAPQTYLSSVLGWGYGPEESALLEDGTSSDSLGGLSLTGLRVMGAGQDLKFLHRITGEMNIVMDVSIDDVHFKQGRGGPLLILQIKRSYFDATNILLVECLETFIGR